MVKKPLELDQIATKLFKKVMEYGHFDSNSKQNLTKVCFLGLNLHPNKDGLWNFDILYLYKALQERGIECRLHDPHIKASQAIALGTHLGRVSQDDNWAQNFDTLILSCPHIYYLKHMSQLYQLFKEKKACLLLDLYGIFNKIAGMSGEYHQVDIVNFAPAYSEGDLLGGLIGQPVPKLPNPDN